MLMRSGIRSNQSSKWQSSRGVETRGRDEKPVWQSSRFVEVTILRANGSTYHRCRRGLLLYETVKGSTAVQSKLEKVDREKGSSES
jgi:hypothetical protein